MNFYKGDYRAREDWILPDYHLGCSLAMLSVGTIGPEPPEHNKWVAFCLVVEPSKITFGIHNTIPKRRM